MSNNTTTDEAMIRDLVEDWAKAVRVKDFDGILAYHSAEMLMFDVPPPLESKGIDAYRETWDLFYSAQPDPIAFDIQRMNVVAGSDVAFVAALMRCAEKGRNGYGNEGLSIFSREIQISERVEAREVARPKAEPRFLKKTRSRKRPPEGRAFPLR